MIVFRKNTVDVEAPGLGVGIASCGILEFKDVDYHLVREGGSGDYQLLYMIDGNGYFNFGGGIHTAVATDAVLYAPGQTQDYAYSGEEGALVMFCHFSGEGAEELLRDCPIPTERLFNGGGECASFADGLRRDDPLLRGNGALAVALLDLLRRISARLMTVAGQDDPIEAALSDIRDGYMLERSVEDYAAMCHFSKYHFLRRFKQRTGMTPIAYRNRYRLSMARQLLRDSNLTLEAVAQAVGFSGATYLCRLYKKHYGTTPRNGN